MLQGLRKTFVMTSLACAVSGFSMQLLADEVKSVKIGAVIPMTGALAGGGAITLTPNIKLWVEEVNKKGGLMLSSIGKRMPIELIEYDDRSENEDAVRAVQRLATKDEADFILAPYGTATNLATGPLFNRYGYPQLAVNAVTEKSPMLAKRWPNSFWFLGKGSDGADALAEMLSAQRDSGKIGNKVAMVSVADGFGIDMARAGRSAFADHGFELVYNKSYPLGSQDLSPLINEAKRKQPDVFVGFSYPPDTFALTEQAKVAGFNPKVFYLGVGTAFPVYGNKFGKEVDGVMGVGGWNPNTPEMQGYISRHKAVTGKEPDRWASAVTYASFEVLGQAIERVGSLDRKAVTKEIQSGEFNTVVGKIKLENNQYKKVWWVGQWQNGDFYGVAPTKFEGAANPVVPKPNW